MPKLQEKGVDANESERRFMRQAMMRKIMHTVSPNELNSHKRRQSDMRHGSGTINGRDFEYYFNTRM